MKLGIIPVTPFQQNCSLLVCESTNRAAVVDPGGDLERILDLVKRANVELEKILLTHGHIDHCGGTAPQLVQEPARDRIRVRPVTVARDVDVPESGARRRRPARGIGGKRALELGLRRKVGVGAAPRDEAHLLDQSPADHEVLVQPELVGARDERALVSPGLRKHEAHVACEPPPRDRVAAVPPPLPCRAHQHLLVADSRALGSRREDTREGECERADRQEVEQRADHGVYQTGDVQARSRIVSGADPSQQASRPSGTVPGSLQSTPRARHA